MSLNKFTSTALGQDLNLKIGCEDLTTDNLVVNTTASFAALTTNTLTATTVNTTDLNSTGTATTNTLGSTTVNTTNLTSTGSAVLRGNIIPGNVAVVDSVLFNADGNGTLAWGDYKTNIADANTYLAATTLTDAGAGSSILATHTFKYTKIQDTLTISGYMTFNPGNSQNYVDMNISVPLFGGTPANVVFVATTNTDTNGVGAIQSMYVSGPSFLDPNTMTLSLYTYDGVNTASAIQYMQFYASYTI